jgi:predicted enzyme related to lactoylglutathione lyase
MLKHIESVVLFVADIGSAAAWYAEIFGTEVGWENPRYAYIRAPGLVIGFHPADSKCPGGVGGTTAYWEVNNLNETINYLVSRGARLHRGPALTSFGAGAAMLIDPFGCSIGLNASTPESRMRLLGSSSSQPSGGANAA